MYTQKEINKALKPYERLGSMRKVIRVLGYPANATLISWLAEKNKPEKFFQRMEWVGKVCCRWKNKRKP